MFPIVLVYNPHGEQAMTSHATDRLEFSGAGLDRGRGYYAVRDTGHPRWKVVLFD
jgi:hypothetical protein